MRIGVFVLTIGILVAGGWTVPVSAGRQADQRDRAAWVSLAKSGFSIPTDRTAFDLLQEMNPLLGSTDPVLRDDIAFAAAERWIRAGNLSPAELRRLLAMWLANTEDGLGSAPDDRVFKRSFSALCLSLIAARDLTAPLLEEPEVEMFFARMLGYFERERDLRGFDPDRGWMHTVAHTADTLKFLARNPKLRTGVEVRLLAAMQTKIEQAADVFAWGENDRMALALQSAVRRPDADADALGRWLEHWADEHKQLWAGGPHVDPRRFARVENARQLLRSLHAALAMETKPTPSGDRARQAILGTLARMR
jgi:hypothetical protein